MLKMVLSLACGGALLAFSQSPHNEKFSGFRTVEAYEIPSDILMMPRYAENGEVCEIGLQKRLYFPGKVSVIDDMSREEIEKVFEELVPVSERGPQSAGLQAHQILEDGSVVTDTFDYENITLEIDGKILPSKRHEIVEEPLVALIHWKNRKCN